MQKLLCAALLAVSLLGAMAQVNVEVVLDQEQFLRSESLPVRIRISNFSGQTLKMAEQPDWLAFHINDDDSRPLLRKEDFPVMKPFEIESSKTVSVRADLMPQFDLSRIGRYRISARVQFPQLEKEVVTEQKKFDIVSGTDIWKREFGVPGRTPPDVRLYTLQVANLLNGNKLYVRISDPNGARVFRVFPLGLVMSFSANTIEAQLDASSNLHVLFQNYKDTFVYAVVAPDGEQIIRQVHEIVGDSRPHMRTEDESRIRIVGGQRRILLSDLPPPRVANTNEVLERK